MQNATSAPTPAPGHCPSIKISSKPQKGPPTSATSVNIPAHVSTPTATTLCTHPTYPTTFRLATPRTTTSPRLSADPPPHSYLGRAPASVQRANLPTAPTTGPLMLTAKPRLVKIRAPLTLRPHARRHSWCEAPRTTITTSSLTPVMATGPLVLDPQAPTSPLRPPPPLRLYHLPTKPRGLKS